jgi:hypothetical protein
MATLHNLPSPQFDALRNAVHGTPITARLDVLPATNTNVPVIKVGEIVFQNGSSLIFQDITLPFIAVYAQDWYFDGPFTVGYSSNLHLDGINGRPALPTPATPAGWGVNGNNGNTGYAGGDGSAAPALPQIVFFAQRIFLGEPGRAVVAQAGDVPQGVLFNFNGLHGGNGGAGGAGGPGTDGNQGEPGQDGSSFFNGFITLCNSGPGFGGRGGDGGAGGVPGQGGNGGDGANVFMFIDPNIAAVFRAMAVSVAGGWSGNEGAYGPPGVPGRGGPGGAKTAGCTADRPGGRTAE